MMKKQKTVLDAEKVVKEFFALVDARREHYKGSDSFSLGYIDAFLRMNANQALLEAMAQRITSERSNGNFV
jgi:hypothetical protein